MLLGSAASIPDEARALDVGWGEAWGNGRFTEAGDRVASHMVPAERLRWVRRLLAPIAGRWLAWQDCILSDVLVEARAEEGYDARPVLGQITAPVLMVAGERDTFLPREVIEETSRGIADCTVVWREGAGHDRTISSSRTRDDVLAFLG